jgi:hypothetical protein
MFSSTMIASSTTKPAAMVMRHQREVVRLKPIRYITPKVPISETGTATAWHQRGTAVSQEKKNHHHDEGYRQQHRALDVAQRLADRTRAVIGDDHLNGRRKRRLQVRQFRFRAIDRVNDVGAGLPEQDHEHGRLAVRQADISDVFDAVRDVRDVGKSNGSAVAIGDDERAELSSRRRLIVGKDLEARIALVQRALRRVGVCGCQGGANVFQPDAVLEERKRIQVDANGRQRAAADLHLPHACYLTEFLLQDRGRKIVDLPGRQRLGGQRQDHDRRVSRVDLAICGVCLERGGQIGARRIDGSLHIASGAVDVAVQPELQGDARRSDGARRRHFVDIGDRAQMTLKRRCYRRRHGHGLAPAMEACTEMVGRSTFGIGETGRRKTATTPARINPRVSNVVATGRAMNGAEMFMARCVARCQAGSPS